MAHLTLNTKENNNGGIDGQKKICKTHRGQIAKWQT